MPLIASSIIKTGPEHCLAIWPTPRKRARLDRLYTSGPNAIGALDTVPIGVIPLDP